MIDPNSLYQQFESFTFEGYSKTVRKILSAYEIVDMTIYSTPHF